MQKTASKTENEAKANIKDAIEKYLKSISFAQDEDGNDIDRISYAKLSSEILDAAGVLDHKDLTINSKKGNIQIGKTEIPKLRNLNIDFVNTFDSIEAPESEADE